LDLDEPILCLHDDNPGRSFAPDAHLSRLQTIDIGAAAGATALRNMIVDAWNDKSPMSSVECDRERPREAGRGLKGRVVINGAIRECVDVECTKLPWPIRPGEPIGLFLR
jgi:hypothetical protein